MRQILLNQNTSMLALLAAVTVFLSIVSERIFVGGGLGYDGAGYGIMAIRFEEFIHGNFQIGTAFYYRFFLSGICHYTLRAMSIELTAENVITFFRIFEVAVLLGACLFWCVISTTLALGRSGKWWGFLGLFGNYAVLKYGFYYPVLTDLSGMLIGLSLLYSYLTRNTFLLMTSTCISFFVWPMATIMGGLLWLAPRNRVALPTVTPSIVNSLIAFLAVTFLLASKILSSETITTASGFKSAIPLSVAIVACYLFYSFRGLLPGLPRSIVETALGPGVVLRILFVLAAVGTTFLLPLLSPAFTVMNWFDLVIDYFSGVIGLGYNRPGEFAVGLFLYYGPILAFIVCYYDMFVDRCRSLGPGFVLVMLLVSVQSLNPLSRQVIAGLPFIVAPLAITLDKVQFSSSFIKVFIFFSLLTSKVWMLNNIDIDTLIPAEKNPVFWQRYTSSTGVWMTDEAYLIQGVILLGGLLILVAYLRCKGAIDSRIK